jgi:hypothetical protein
MSYLGTLHADIYKPKTVDTYIHTYYLLSNASPLISCDFDQKATANAEQF